ncbi:MAG: hypothetical protein MN733_36590 [Nitrososphaera sp.]|nr:hypothetical protein [Nitrososphaera sp.]
MGIFKKFKKRMGPKGMFGLKPIFFGKYSPVGMSRGMLARRAKGKPIGGAKERYPYKFE